MEKSGNRLKGEVSFMRSTGLWSLMSAPICNIACLFTHITCTSSSLLGFTHGSLASWPTSTPTLSFSLLIMPTAPSAFSHTSSTSLPTLLHPCPCPCMHAHPLTCMPTHMHAHSHACPLTCMPTHMHAHSHACPLTCIQTCSHACCLTHMACPGACHLHAPTHLHNCMQTCAVAP